MDGQKTIARETEASGSDAASRLIRQDEEPFRIDSEAMAAIFDAVSELKNKGSFSVFLKDAMIGINARHGNPVVHINVRNDGNTFAIDYAGRLPAKFQFTYRESNEWLNDPTVEALRRINGIRHFVGVAGGLSIPLELIGMLRDKNELNSGMLVDTSASQILQDIMMLQAYNQVFAGDARLREIVSERVPLHTERLLGIYPRSWHAVPVTSIRFENADIRYALRGLPMDGPYFIYLSNAFTFPIRLGQELRKVEVGDGTSFVIGYNYGGILDGIETLRAVLLNGRIRDGSCVMVTSPGEYNMILQKGNGSFSVMSAYCKCHGSGYADKHLASMKRYIAALTDENTCKDLFDSEIPAKVLMWNHRDQKKAGISATDPAARY